MGISGRGRGVGMIHPDKKQFRCKAAKPANEERGP